MALTRNDLLKIKENYVTHGLLTGGNMAIPEQIDLLLAGKKLCGAAYVGWSDNYCQLDPESNELVSGKPGYVSSKLLGEHYTISIID